jgi:signal transduction histidine kinase
MKVSTRPVAAFALASISFLFFFTNIPNTVYAASKDINVQASVDNPDVCPNIPGHQSSIPDGMAVDANGNCYTPPPTSQDLCLNIPGFQTVVPNGYYRTMEGNCYPQTTPPRDVCPNLPGIQTSIPDDHYLDPNTNTCSPVTPPPEPPADEDVCLNIPGIQTSTPAGMKNDDGYCFTPSTPLPPPPLPPTPEPEQPLANIPDFLQPLFQFLVSLIPENVREFFENLPEEVVDQIPLYIFILFLILVLIPILQSIREYLYNRRLMAFYKREQNIAEEKGNFITIASHYLRTPIAIMKDSIPMMVTAGDITNSQSPPLNKALQTLGDQISASLDAANNNPALKNATNLPAIKPKPFWRSLFFWLPIVLSIVLTLLVNFFIGVVGNREIGTSNALLQLFIIVAFIVILYLVVRNYHIQKKLREERDALIAREQTIDSIRNNFLDQQAANISTALSALFLTSSSSSPSQAYNLYNDGISRLSSIHDKFILLSQIKTGANRSASAFNLKFTVERAIEAKQKDITAKKLAVQSSVDNTLVVQNEPLFSFVISSVLDNAIKFADPGGRILIANHPQNKTILIKVSNSGRSIDAAKLDQLFKPFSRTESAVDFSYEGLGLSLFLGRLILDYTGGSISATPRPNGGTDVVITTPTDVNIQNKFSPK